MLKTRKSNPNKPPRVLVYAGEGLGKSTLGAMAEDPVFISPEGGTDHLRTKSGNPVDEMPNIKTFDDIKSAIRQLTNEHHDFKTLCVDSADWVETVCHQKIVGGSGLDIIRVNKGYGAGYRESQRLHKELIMDLEELREKRNMSIIVTAHAHVKAVKDPESEMDYDSYEIKCQEYVSSLWREWVDALFFVRLQTMVKTSDDTAKARAVSNGTRILYPVKQPAFQAKNRYGMVNPVEFTFDFWPEFMSLVKSRGIVEPIESATDVKSEIADLFIKISSDSTKNAVADAIEKAGEDVKELIVIRNRLRQITATKGE